MDSTAAHQQLPFFEYVQRNDNWFEESLFPNGFRYQRNRKELCGKWLISPLQDYLFWKDTFTNPLARVGLKIYAAIALPFAFLGTIFKKWGERQNPGYPIREQIFSLKTEKGNLSKTTFSTSRFCNATTMALYTLGRCTHILFKSMQFGQWPPPKNNPNPPNKPVFIDIQNLQVNPMSSDNMDFFCKKITKHLKGNDANDLFVQEWLKPFAQIFQLFQQDLTKPWTPSMPIDSEIYNSSYRYLPDSIALWEDDKIKEQQEQRKALFQQARQRITNYVETIDPDLLKEGEELKKQLDELENVVKHIPAWKKRHEIETQIKQLYSQLEAVYKTNK